MTGLYTVFVINLHHSSLPDDCKYKVELAVTSDGRTRAGHHPSLDFPYEHTKPVPQLAPVLSGGETDDLLLKKQVRR